MDDRSRTTKSCLIVLVLAATLLAPLASMAANLATRVKVGKIRAGGLSQDRGSFRITQPGDRDFDGCTVDAGYFFGFDTQLQWPLLLEAKRSNADVRLIYRVVGPGELGRGRCFLVAVEWL
jgi:hypothetical protein